MKKFIKLFFVFSLYTLYFILNTGLVNAQAVSLSLSPTLSELAIKPGRVAMIKYSFVNNGDPAIIKFRVQPYDKKAKIPLIFDLASNKFKLGEPHFFKNSVSDELFLNIQVPEETPEKDYYFDFVAESQPPPTQEGIANIRAKITLKS